MKPKPNPTSIPMGVSKNETKPILTPTPTTTTIPSDFHRHNIKTLEIEEDYQDDEDEYLDNVYNNFSPEHTSARLRRLTLLLLTALTLFLTAAYTMYRSLTAPSRYAPVHPSFTLIKSVRHSSYGATSHWYRHTKTGAEFLGLVPDDVQQDKSFGVSFRTLPQDDSGIPHILEHSVLSGSERYPVKDPFLFMTKGSLATFLNAMTYPDRTVYPIASRNTKDYRNLVNVYLDAVFRPRCVTSEGEWVLRQEGWRYEPLPFEDESTPDQSIFEIKGVVYSEMKGVFSNPEQRMNRHTSKYLFPSSPYRFESGGDPEVIPTLTQEAFVEFYHRHYHPTNAKLFASGTPADIRGVLHDAEVYLSTYEYEPALKDATRVPFQKKNWSSPVSHREYYPVESLEDDRDTTTTTTTTGQCLFAITWLLNDNHWSSPVETLTWYVLDRLLASAQTGRLYRALMDSSLGTDVIGYGLDDGLLQYTFAMGMKGVYCNDDDGETDVDTLEQLIMDELGAIVAGNGWEEDDLEAAVNAVEFQLRDVGALMEGGKPLGINVFQNVLTYWNYDLDPQDSLEFEDTLMELKRKVAAEGSRYFQNFVQEYLLENNHRLHLTLHPSVTMEAEKAQAETKKLLRFQNSLSTEELQNILHESEHLHKIQTTEDTPANIATIPSLSISDIDPLPTEYPSDPYIHNIHNSGITLIPTPVSVGFGIVNVHLAIDLSGAVNFEDVGLLPLLSSLVLEGGITGRMDRAELNRAIDTYTGGIVVTTLMTHALPAGSPSFENGVTKAIDPNDVDSNIRTMWLMKGKATAAQTPVLLDLMFDILMDANVDRRAEVLQIIDRKIAGIQSGIQSKGHQYALTRMKARYDPLKYITELQSGVSQLTVLEAVKKDVEEDWNGVMSRLESMRSGIARALGWGSAIVLTGEARDVRASQKDLKRVLKYRKVVERNKNVKKPKHVPHPWLAPAREHMLKFANEGIVVSSQVSYVGKSGQLYNPSDIISGSTDVVLQYLNKGYLWHRVREQNGAYGVHAYLDPWAGDMSFVSYRDPLLASTLTAYDDAAESLYEDLQNGAVSIQSVTTAIVGSIGRTDGSAPNPGTVGFWNLLDWLTGKGRVHRQRWRKEVLETDEKDFAAFTDRLANWMNPSVAVVGSSSAIKEASEKGVYLKLVQTDSIG